MTDRLNTVWPIITDAELKRWTRLLQEVYRGDAQDFQISRKEPLLRAQAAIGEYATKLHNSKRYECHQPESSGVRSNMAFRRLGGR